MLHKFLPINNNFYTRGPFQKMLGLICNYLYPFTISTDDESTSYSRWPAEPFSLIQASTGCPKGFEPGQFVEYSYYSSVSSDTYSALTSSDQSLQYQFCTKPQTSPIGEQTTWGPGSYCIIRSGGSCPEGKHLSYDAWSIFMYLSAYVHDFVCLWWSKYKP